ncbi:DASH complex subunit dad2 [Friedmanniomyces endolithicus]|uniref:DASH complex subunit DAD2 n=1 Tax=Friedmanniomyces endolithicus TaxID=329885 RepID=A0AAN6R104_9PEZI|nr:DASH complex subunit dad2 [Friedmanniomyces endolithicus]KAK0797565.1 DASH complex subunit dad2 [Friedmanniomyces endolithicus]KAK0817149.1 DASH complex subunit dad2 [Friedmanniomyces endolithicus]KAK0819944.1 DASH complex subunit dad2 [Friedmanniomyces endolithicus]KAK0834174.1 DASH complex subunit dad2 [Friedmanniomyces endolithicus]
MSFRPTLPSHIRPRPSSGLGLRNSNPSASTASNNPQTSALHSRIAEKKVELESLRQLRDLSAGLAGQMQQLEEKLATLGTGTEAVAAVMGNWNQVLRAVFMASGESKIPKPDKGGEEEEDAATMPLPQTLVRIPIQQSEALQKEAEAAQTAGE